MPTLLTNPRLSRELAERIERRLGTGWSIGKRRDPSAKAFHRPRPTSLARLLPFLAFVAVVGLYISLRIYDGNALERRRAALIEAIATRRAELPPERPAPATQVERWATALAADPGTEVLAPEIASASALDGRLRHPAVYLRGRARDLKTPASLASATTSLKDSFLLCLFTPPASRDQRDVLAKIRGVHFGGAKLDELTSNVLRFEHAQAGLAVIGTDFEERVRKAETEAVLRTLEHAFEAAPADAAKQAGAAELLVLVVDESDGNQDERDGAPHDARVALVDLGADRVLLRTRKRLDASRWPADRRAMYGGAIQGCELALDVRELATRAPP